MLHLIKMDQNSFHFPGSRSAQNLNQFKFCNLIKKSEVQFRQSALTLNFILSCILGILTIDD